MTSFQTVSFLSPGRAIVKASVTKGATMLTLKQKIADAWKCEVDRVCIFSLEDIKNEDAFPYHPDGMTCYQARVLPCRESSEKKSLN
jgi:hypothetical protein